MAGEEDRERIADNNEVDLVQSVAEDLVTNRPAVPDVPASLKPFESVAQGYKHYMRYLKSGGTSGISGLFGKVEIEEDDLSWVTQASEDGTEWFAEGDEPDDRDEAADTNQSS